MSVSPKRDSTGEEFRVRRRGGKKAKRQQELAEAVERGDYTPSHLWSAERRTLYSDRAADSVIDYSAVEESVPARRADTGSRKRKTPNSPEGCSRGFGGFPSVGGADFEGRSEVPQPEPGSYPDQPPLGSSKVTTSSSSSRSLLLVAALPLRPQPGSLADPSSAATRDLGSRPRVPRVVGGSARAVIDFHGVLDVDPQATVRAGRCVFATGVSEVASRHLRSALSANRDLQILILSYIGKYSSKRRRETTESVERLKISLGNLGFRVALEICDRREDKPDRRKELEAACLVDDNWHIVSGARDCVGRSIWFSADSSKAPRGVHKTFDWGEVASYLARISATPSPQVWDNLFN